MWRVRQGSSLTGLSIRIGLQGLKPGESNKLFDLLFRHKTRIRLIRQIRGSEIYTHPLAYCPPGRVWCIGLSWHTSSVGVPGYSTYCPPGSRALCEAECPVRIGRHITSIPHALRCLEGTTMSNRGQRPRIYDTPPNLCLEGSTPEDRKVYSCLSPCDGCKDTKG